MLQKTKKNSFQIDLKNNSSALFNETTVYGFNCQFWYCVQIWHVDLLKVIPDYVGRVLS